MNNLSPRAEGQKALPFAAEGGKEKTFRQTAQTRIKKFVRPKKKNRTDFHCNSFKNHVYYDHQK
ncbi:MAG: hypothetical protein HDT15_12625 [Oscillibacter sp.]|nr:hypothetical protein [Oscillibacter sp.]